MTSNNRLKLVLPQIPAGEHRMEIMFNGVPFPGAPKLAIAPETEVRRAPEFDELAAAGGWE